MFNCPVSKKHYTKFFPHNILIIQNVIKINMARILLIRWHFATIQKHEKLILHLKKSLLNRRNKILKRPNRMCLLSYIK